MEHTPEIRLNMSTFAVWKRMMGYMKPYRGWAIITLLGIIGSIILMIVIPGILRDVIDIGIDQSDGAYMVTAGLLVVGLGILRGITGFLFRYFGERLSHFVAYDIRNEVYNKVQTLSFSYHDDAQTGTLITRAISDVDEIQRYFAFGLIDGLNTFFLLIGVSVIMFISSPLLAVIALLPLIPLAVLSRNFVMEIEPRWKGIMERIQKLSNHLQENAIGAQVVRAFARERFEIDKFSSQNQILFREQLSFVHQWVTYLPFSAFIVALSTALVLFFGGLMEQQNISGVTVGLIVSFNAYVLLVAQPMRFLGFVILLTTQAIGSSQRVFEILDAPVAIQSRPDAPLMPQIQGHVVMENVSFQYEGATTGALHHVSIEAYPGQVIALLGPTGAGKSTLVNLIARFYDVSAGRVLIDGQDVRDVELHSLRRQIGFVLQESLLFSATIRENIAYGRPDASEEDIIKAAKAANAHDFIMEFPEQYETIIGERGVTLSGGQRQRIAIARSLLIDPRILILDDATSSVDTQTEFLIQEALKRLMKGRTTFVIAQRLTTVINADQILIIENGEIVERGTHQELLALNGPYAEIYRLQLADQERLRREMKKLGYLKGDEKDKTRATSEFKAIIDRASGD